MPLTNWPTYMYLVLQIHTIYSTVRRYYTLYSFNWERIFLQFTVAEYRVHRWLKTHNNNNCNYFNVDSVAIQFLFLIRARFIWRVSTYYKHNFMRPKLTLLHLNLLYSYIQGQVHKSHKLLNIFILSWLGRHLL